MSSSDVARIFSLHQEFEKDRYARYYAAQFTSDELVEAFRQADRLAQEEKASALATQREAIAKGLEEMAAETYMPAALLEAARRIRAGEWKVK